MINICINNDIVGSNEILQNHISNLTSVSLDDKHDVSMINDDNVQVISFDEVKEEKYGRGSSFMSNDALFWKNDSKYNMVFLEFKNGDFKHRDIRLKNYDSISLLASVLDRNIEELKNNLEYILVYRDNSIDRIQSSVGNRSNKYKMNLSVASSKMKMEKHFFKSMRAMTVNEFKEEFM